MAVGLRKLASKLSGADIKRLSKAQKLESTRERLEKEEKKYAKRAAKAAKRRARVERKLDALFGKKAGKVGRPRKAKRKMSAAGRARIGAAARRRWKRYWAEKKSKSGKSAALSAAAV